MADDVQTQRTELEAVADELDRLLGPSDRHTLRARTVLAHTVSDPQVALPRYAELCEAYARHHPEELASCLYDHGLRLSEARELERAAEVLERAAVLFAELEGSVPAQLPVRHALARGQALACRGRHAEVVAELRGVLDGLADREPPRWMEASVLALDVVLGEALVAELRHAEAIAALEPAVGALARRAALRVDHAVERLLVRARLALARAHVDALADDAIVTPDAATAAAALLDAAEPRVREAGSGGAWQLHEIEALREELPARPG
jgi:tetratricopeptide (TPR) repeat protein